LGRTYSNQEREKYRAAQPFRRPLSTEEKEKKLVRGGREKMIEGRGGEFLLTGKNAGRPQGYTKDAGFTSMKIGL